LGKRPSFVTLREVSAVVSEMNAPNLELTSETVLCHEHVVEFVMKAHTVLPVRFGTVLGSVHNVKEFLMQFYDNIINNIEKVQGKVELGLKVMIKEPAEPSPDDANGEEEKPDGSLTPAREYLMARIREEKKQQKILEETGKSIDEICHTLSVYSDETCVRKLTTEIMILNASFLVDKNKVSVFSQSVQLLMRRHPDLAFLFSGPWPPYNFVGLKEGAQKDA